MDPEDILEIMVMVLALQHMTRLIVDTTKANMGLITAEASYKGLKVTSVVYHLTLKRYHFL